MRETIELRIRAENARKWLPDSIGKDIGYGVRKVVVDTSDPLFAEIARLHHMFRAEGKYFFSGWEYNRQYSRRDLEVAELFHIWVRRVFEPAGEECGTVYDESSVCDCSIAQMPETEIGGHKIPPSTDRCGAGARQVTPLFLDGRRIPRKADFARTIADEIVVSARAVAVFREEELSGIDFDPVRLSNQGGSPSQDHYRMRIVGETVELHPVTRLGEGPFDESGYGRCPCSHIAGLNLLSEVTIRRESLVNADVLATKQLVGVRRGLLRPRPILLLSPRAWRTVKVARLKGLSIEVAHLE